MPRVRFKRVEVTKYASKYDEGYSHTDEAEVEQELKNWLAKHKYLDRRRFIKLGLWKSHRVKKHYQSKINSDERVKEVTRLALASKDEYFKVKSLMMLPGVKWPVGSVILHFTHPNKYPILDYRTIWSLGWKQPKSYNYEFWLKYTKYLRDQAKKLNVSLRTLDKALWRYSKENQK